ncbi:MULTISPECIES: type II secretion system F family protein [Cohaesibacter]|uniref:type II secretion system F family protein n=1 Tax=Cohaesibacter TaxID=655352 RepID=UPI000DEBE991|nr:MULTISPECIES: type II secretion system F family protein [Cohaesibacter]TLP45995.1 type II secretion system F family protein [Cohaesibacter sp. CAU 1516]
MDFVTDDLIFTIALFALVVFAVVGIAWGLFYPKLSKDHRRRQRMETISISRVHLADKRIKAASADRRKDLETSLKKIEEAQKQGAKKKQTLSARLVQAGLEIKPRTFWFYSMICGAICFLGALIGGMSLLVSLGIGIVGLIGLPNLWLARKRKKRINKFIAEFPNAIDVIVRGIRTGLPLGDCIVIASSETAEPVRSEFKRLVDEQAMGLPLSAVVPRLHERVPIAETNFFAIVIAIQAQAGGSLSEALGNLSRVLRSRAQMKEKISAMSMEAKASAAIIAAMPFIIAFMTYLTSPDYIMVMFTHPMGHMVMAATFVWMAIGIIMMRSMINFDI